MQGQTDTAKVNKTPHAGKITQYLAPFSPRC